MTRVVDIAGKFTLKYYDNKLSQSGKALDNYDSDIIIVSSLNID